MVKHLLLFILLVFSVVSAFGQQPCANPIQITRVPAEWNSIKLDIRAGIPPYTYMWSNGIFREDLYGLTPGTYCITATDSDGCSKDTCFTIRGDGTDLMDLSVSGLMSGTYPIAVLESSVPCGVPTFQLPFTKTQTSINVKWKQMTGAQAYQISWRELSATRFTTVSVNDVNLHSYIIQNLRPRTSYLIRVRTKCSTSWTGWATQVVNTN